MLRNVPYEKSFATHPKSAYWDYEKNYGRPENYSLKSEKKFWFKCDKCIHNFIITLASVSAGCYCSYCANLKLCQDDCETCFNKSFASHEKNIFWDYNKNKLTPREVFRSSNKKFWLNCSNCFHSYDISLSNVIKGRSCPFCCFPPQRLCQEDCEKCFNNSFASDERSLCWNYNKNELSPRDVFKKSNKKFWFLCIECGHEFQTILSSITNKNNCPYCANQKLCLENTCELCLNKSFASHNKSKYWNLQQNKITPREIFMFTHEKYYFSCVNCNHNFKISISKITSRNQFCQYCGNQKICTDKDCKICFNKSFASIKQSKYWDLNKNKITPREVFGGSHKKYWFICENKHEFLSALDQISGRSRWCSQCINKTETKFYEEIQLYQPNIVRQFKADWCKNRFTNKHLPFDFVLEELKIIIEIDGPQHFRQISNWDSNKKTRLKDIYKMNCANKNGYRVIRIIQEDIFYDRTNWLTDALTAISAEGNVFICYNDEYINHKDLSQVNPYNDDSELTLNYFDVNDENVEDVKQEITKNIIMFNGLELVDDLVDV